MEEPPQPRKSARLALRDRPVSYKEQEQEDASSSDDGSGSGDEESDGEHEKPTAAEQLDDARERLAALAGALGEGDEVACFGVGDLRGVRDKLEGAFRATLAAIRASEAQAAAEAAEAGAVVLPDSCGVLSRLPSELLMRVLRELTVGERVRMSVLSPAFRDLMERPEMFRDGTFVWSCRHSPDRKMTSNTGWLLKGLRHPRFALMESFRVVSCGQGCTRDYGTMVRNCNTGLGTMLQAMPNVTDLDLSHFVDPIPYSHGSILGPVNFSTGTVKRLVTRFSTMRGWYYRNTPPGMLGKLGLVKIEELHLWLNGPVQDEEIRVLAESCPMLRRLVVADEWTENKSRCSSHDGGNITFDYLKFAKEITLPTLLTIVEKCPLTHLALRNVPCAVAGKTEGGLSFREAALALRPACSITLHGIEDETNPVTKDARRRPGANSVFSKASTFVVPWGSVPARGPAPMPPGY